MSGPEVVQEINTLSEKTWDSKAKNTIRLLDDNGYKDHYSYDHFGDKLTVLFFARHEDNSITVIKEFVFDLSSDTTERQFLVVVDDYFGQFENDRSYDWEQDTGAKL
jgi:hypothetical protein